MKINNNKTKTIIKTRILDRTDDVTVKNERENYKNRISRQNSKNNVIFKNILIYYDYLLFFEVLKY